MSNSIKIVFFCALSSITICHAMEKELQDCPFKGTTKITTQSSKQMTIFSEDNNVTTMKELKNQRRGATVTPPSSPVINIEMPELLNPEKEERKKKRFAINLGKGLPILPKIEEIGQLTRLSLLHSKKRLAEIRQKK